jgi:hypothetical protein
MCPVVVIDRDYDYIESCLEILKSRVYKEHHPSPASTPGTTPPPVGRPTTITSPKAPTPPPPTSPVRSRASDQRSGASDTRHLAVSIMAVKQRTVVERKEAELKEAREELTLERQLHHQKLCDTEIAFGIQAHYLEIKQAPNSSQRPSFPH